MKITIIPKYNSTFLDPLEIEVERDSIVNYELPLELIGRIQSREDNISIEKARAIAKSNGTVNAYLVIKEVNNE